MAELQNFRSALGGFNREDVVRYIEYINTKHKNEVNQLKAEIQALKEDLNSQAGPTELELELTALLEESRAACAALEEELVLVKAQLEEAAAREANYNELEVYRRAERMERIAQERVKQLCDQANGTLADASAKIDDAAMHIGTMADTLAAQLGTLQSAVLASKSTLHNAATAMFAIRPISLDE